MKRCVFLVKRYFHDLGGLTLIPNVNKNAIPYPETLIPGPHTSDPRDARRHQYGSSHQRRIFQGLWSRHSQVVGHALWLVQDASNDASALLPCMGISPSFVSTSQFLLRAVSWVLQQILQKRPGTPLKKRLASPHYPRSVPSPIGQKRPPHRYQTLGEAEESEIQRSFTARCPRPPHRRRVSHWLVIHKNLSSSQYPKGPF